MGYQTEPTESSDLVRTKISARAWNEGTDRSQYQAHDRNETPHSVRSEHRTNPPAGFVWTGHNVQVHAEGSDGSEHPDHDHSDHSGSNRSIPSEHNVDRTRRSRSDRSGCSVVDWAERARLAQANLKSVHHDSNSRLNQNVPQVRKARDKYQQN